jgi:hypothetical protein
MCQGILIKLLAIDLPGDFRQGGPLCWGLRAAVSLPYSSGGDCDEYLKVHHFESPRTVSAPTRQIKEQIILALLSPTAAMRDRRTTGIIASYARFGTDARV